MATVGRPLDPPRSGCTARPGTPLVMLHCLGMTHHLWDCLSGLVIAAS